MYTYNGLRRKIESLGSVIDAPKEFIPGFENENQYAHPYVKIRFPYFYLIVSENGKEISRKKFQNVDMLMYEIFKNITFEMALQFEIVHRIPNRDFRRIVFSYQLDLMRKLSSKWAKYLENEISSILEKNPYRDD